MGHIIIVYSDVYWLKKADGFSQDCEGAAPAAVTGWRGGCFHA